MISRRDAPRYQVAPIDDSEAVRSHRIHVRKRLCQAPRFRKRYRRSIATCFKLARAKYSPVIETAQASDQGARTRMFRMNCHAYFVSNQFDHHLAQLFQSRLWFNPKHPWLSADYQSTTLLRLGGNTSRFNLTKTLPVSAQRVDLVFCRTFPIQANVRCF